MEAVQAFVKNAVKLPAAGPKIVANIQKLQSYHAVVEESRDANAPLAYFTFDHEKQKTTWHPAAHAWVDDALSLSKKEYNEYCWLKKDMSRLTPLTSPLVFGTYGLIPLAVWLSNDGYLPSAFSSKSDIVAKKLEWYEAYGDEVRQKMGPMLQHQLKRVLRGCLNSEHLYLHDELVESYKELFYSHYTGATRDVRKAAHMRMFDAPPRTLILTNKDPVELTAELDAKLSEIQASSMSVTEKKAAIKAAVIDAYKAQELRGGPSTNEVPGMELPGDNQLLGENGTDENYIEPPEEEITIEQLEVTGDRVIIPMEFRTQMEDWERELQKMANEFLLLPFRFVTSAWNQRRLTSWYEECLQEDALIKKEGGVQSLSDDELKVVLLDRAVMRCDEGLTRGDMEARYKEISWLMEQRLGPFIILAWQTGYYRSTYSPEDDLPEPSILPQFNRSILDVDVHNPLKPDDIGQPRPVVHPALYPNAHHTMAAEVALMK